MLVLSPACAVLLDFQEPTDLALDASSTGEAPVDGVPRRAPGADADTSSSEANAETAADLETGAPADATSDAAPSDGPNDSSENDGASSPAACHSCVPVVPSGWYGPLAIHEGNGAGTAPPCSGDFSVRIYDGLAAPTAPDAECSCACEAPANVSCSKSELTFYVDSTCRFTCGSPASNGQAGIVCARPMTQACEAKDVRAFKVSPSVPSGGTCAPAASAHVSPATWSSSVRLCGRSFDAPASGCNGAGTCAGGVLPPFAATNRCVLRPGAWACPSGYPVSRTFYETATDTRACTGCSCGSPSGGTCAPSVATYDTTSCSTVGTTVVAPSSCNTTTGVQRMTVSAPVASGGACPPSGGTPTGAFTPESPSTVCCLE